MAQGNTMSGCRAGGRVGPRRRAYGCGHRHRNRRHYTMIWEFLQGKGRGCNITVIIRCAAARAVPGDKRRAHCARRGAPAGKRSLCSLRANACGDVSTKSIVFLSFRTGPKRLPRPASWGSPPPKAVPALGIHPASGLTSLLFRNRCSISHNASSFQD